VLYAMHFVMHQRVTSADHGPEHQYLAIRQQRRPGGARLDLRAAGGHRQFGVALGPCELWGRCGAGGTSGAGGS
jgi:hypothetical protein